MVTLFKKKEPLDTAKKPAFSAREIALVAMLTALALAAHAVEALFPPIAAGFPMKLGLANVFALAALLLFSPREAFLVTVLRCTLGALIMGSPSSLMYSLAGGLLSVGGMSLALPLLKKDRISCLGLSVLGAFLFNVGQLGVGTLIVGRGVVCYLPLMSLFSLPTGLIVGAAAAGSCRVLGRFTQKGAIR